MGSISSECSSGEATSSGLSSIVRVLRESIGEGRSRKVLRRPILIDRNTGLLRELQTAFVYRTQGQKARNTQVAYFRDLAFFDEWCKLKEATNLSWMRPELRVKKQKLALSPKEISDFSRWCTYPAKTIATALAHLDQKTQRLHTSSSVDTDTVNRRLRTASSYLQWITQEFIEGLLDLDTGSMLKAEKASQIIRNTFNQELRRNSKSKPPRSYSEEETEVLHQVLNSGKGLGRSDVRDRNRLIVRLLYESALRAGELLKLYCSDVVFDYRITGQFKTGVVLVRRRPNDPYDERENDPSVKAIPGPVPIPNSLAQELFDYIQGERRASIRKRVDSRDTPYLFINHSGPNVGRPMSQRNLNKILKTLGKVDGLPGWTTPHVMRHTHLTEHAELIFNNERDPIPFLISRGRWSPNSNTYNIYTERFWQKKAAEMTNIRDREIHRS